ncbi:MAG: monofunctional biosynthetic peptidoglycan transglycosylase [Flavobacteriaceae bacterium]
MTGSRQEMWDRGIGRRLLRVGLIALAVFLLLPYLLVVLYRFVDPPVSTLTLARYATLQPVFQHWTPYDDLSRNLVHAVLMSEDAKFCVHSGVDFDALRSVVDSLDDEDIQTRGASTIAMQTAKNLFLWPGQNYVRKALEIPLALWIDFVWPKRRIVEVYLNIAEWGDGVFGAAAATERHFGEGPSRLTPRQAALLAASLPNPLVRNPGRPGPGLSRLATRVEARARAAGPWVRCLEG